MHLANKTIVVPFDFTEKFIKNFVNAVSCLESNLYFITTDRSVNAKSILGIMSVKILKGDMMVVNVYGSSQERAEKELDSVCRLICGDE